MASIASEGLPVAARRHPLSNIDARGAHSGAEFPGFRLLLAGKGESKPKVSFGLGAFRIGCLGFDFTRRSVRLGLEPRFLSCLDCRECVTDAALCVT